MNCITWNSRGTSSKGFPKLVRELVEKYEVDIFSILEPRCNGEKAVE